MAGIVAHAIKELSPLGEAIVESEGGKDAIKGVMALGAGGAIEGVVSSLGSAAPALLTNAGSALTGIGMTAANGACAAAEAVFGSSAASGLGTAFSAVYTGSAAASGAVVSAAIAVAPFALAIGIGAGIGWLGAKLLFD